MFPTIYNKLIRRRPLLKNIVTTALSGLLIFQLFIPMQADIPEEERAALIALYHATGGDKWEKNTGWKTEPLENDGFGTYGSEGQWFGITTTGDHVTGISFENNGLSGSLPPELGHLCHLKILSFVSEIKLTGGIPREWGNLSRLEHLGLLFNRNMSGEFPREPDRNGDSQKKRFNR